MGDSIKLRLGRVARDQRGFTLIEMLVVVGIIVALAAIIVPLVIAFSGSGEEAAQDGERETIQTAIQSMMVDNDMSSGDITAVTTAGGAKVTNTQDMGSGITLANYVDKASTVYCYVYGDDGIIDEQWDVNASDACATTGTTQLFPKHRNRAATSTRPSPGYLCTVEQTGPGMVSKAPAGPSNFRR